MPTEVNIGLGIHGVTLDGTLVGEKKFLNLIAGENMDITAVVNAGTDSIDITFNSASVVSPPPVDPSETPIEVGTPLIIPTTLPVGSVIDRMVIVGSDLNGAQLQVGFDNQPDLVTTSFTGTVFINRIFGIESLPSDTPNINIVLTAVGGNVTTGTFRIKIETT